MHSKSKTKKTDKRLKKKEKGRNNANRKGQGNLTKKETTQQKNKQES